MRGRVVRAQRRTVMVQEPEPDQEYGVWTNLKHGLQVGAGFFIGYFIMRFMTLAAMIVGGFMLINMVCVPKCEQYDRSLVAPVENAIGIKVVNPPEVMWLHSCQIRERPTTNSAVLGYVYPKQRYVILNRKGSWIKVGSFTIRGWVGCKSYRPGSIETVGI